MRYLAEVAENETFPPRSTDGGGGSFGEENGQDVCVNADL